MSNEEKSEGSDGISTVWDQFDPISESEWMKLDILAPVNPKNCGPNGCSAQSENKDEGSKNAHN